MNDNIKLKFLERDIYSLMGEYNLPVGSIYYLLKDILQNVENMYQTNVNQELQKLEKQKKEKEQQQKQQVEEVEVEQIQDK